MSHLFLLLYTVNRTIYFPGGGEGAEKKCKKKKLMNKLKLILKASLSNLLEVDEVVVVGSTRQALGQAHLWVRKNCW